MNAKSHITTFKWRHINAFPVHLSSNNSLEQCAVHAHEIVFFSREAWTVLPWRAFWIGVLNQRFKTLILPSQNKHERSQKNVRLRSWLEQNADSGGSMNAKSHITTFKWRHINAFPVHLSSNNSLEQCAVHAYEIVFFSREAWTVLPWRAFWIGVLNQRFKTLILPSQNKHERSQRRFKTALRLSPLLYRSVFLAQTRFRSPFFPRLRKAFLTP